MNYQPTLGLIQVAPSQTEQQRVDPGQAFKGSQGASQLLGQLSRAQWQDWTSRYSPYVDELGRMAQDANAPGVAAQNARQAVGAAFEGAGQSLNMQRQAYGMTLSPAQQQADQRRTALERSAAQVSAGNDARISAQDRQQAILAGGMGLSTIPSQVFS